MGKSNSRNNHKLQLGIGNYIDYVTTKQEHSDLTRLGTSFLDSLDFPRKQIKNDLLLHYLPLDHCMQWQNRENLIVAPWLCSCEIKNFLLEAQTVLVQANVQMFLTCELLLCHSWYRTKSVIVRIKTLLTICFFTCA